MASSLRLHHVHTHLSDGFHTTKELQDMGVVVPCDHDNILANVLLGTVIAMEGYVEHEGQTKHITLFARNQEEYEALCNLLWKRKFTLQDVLDSQVAFGTGCSSSPLHEVVERMDFSALEPYKDRCIIEIFPYQSKHVENEWRKRGFTVLPASDYHGPADELELLFLARPPSFWGGKKMVEKLEANPAYFTSVIDAGEALERFLDTYPPFKPSHPLPPIPREFVARLWELASTDSEAMREFNILASTGFVEYVAFVVEYVRRLKERGITVAIRGSARGSHLVSLAFGLPSPAPYGAIFERFFHEKRITAPDIDIDVDDQDKAVAVLKEFVSELGGKVAKLTNYVTFTELTATKRLLQAKVGTVTAKLQGQDMESFVRKSPLVPDALRGTLLRAMGLLAGRVCTTGSTAAGFIVSKYIPVRQKTGDCMFSANTVDSVGGFKVDILQVDGLSNVVEVKEVPTKVKWFQATAGIPHLCQYKGGLTAKAIFMLKGELTVEDLMLVLALIRPGVPYAGYVLRKTYGEHPLFDLLYPNSTPEKEPIVYQEDLMMAVYKVTGSWEYADKVRKAVAKKDPNPDALSLVERLGYDPSTLNYSFNRAHALSYAEVVAKAIKALKENPGRVIASYLNQHRKKGREVAHGVYCAVLLLDSVKKGTATWGDRNTLTIGTSTPLLPNSDVRRELEEFCAPVSTIISMRDFIKEEKEDEIRGLLIPTREGTTIHWVVVTAYGCIPVQVFKRLRERVGYGIHTVRFIMNANRLTKLCKPVGIGG